MNRMLPQNQPGRSRIESVEADLVPTGAIIVLSHGVLWEVVSHQRVNRSQIMFHLRNVNHPDKTTQHVVMASNQLKVRNW